MNLLSLALSLRLPTAPLALRSWQPESFVDATFIDPEMPRKTPISKRDKARPENFYAAYC